MEIAGSTAMNEGLNGGDCGTVLDKSSQFVSEEMKIPEGSGLELKSFCEVGKFASLVRGFDNGKRELISDIGFEGLLRIPCIKSLDEKFSLWLMSRLDPETMVFCLPNGEKLEFADVDAHFVLGIPFKGKLVIHDNYPGKEAVKIVLGILGIEGNPGSLSLEFLEGIITKDYGPVKMTKVERATFKVAFVLYSMASFLAVQHQRCSFPTWLLRNFTDPSKIAEINWSAYVLNVLSHGAREVQSQLRSGSRSIKIYGCTFLLQVLYLDNLCFGNTSPVLLELPRSSTYTEDYIKYLIKMDHNKEASNNSEEYGCHKLRKSVEVCYSRGWKGTTQNQRKEYEDRYVSASEIFHKVLMYDDKLAALLAPSLCSVSAITSCDIRETYKSWYPGYTAIFTPMQAENFLQCDDCLTPPTKVPKGACSPDSALKMLAETACKHADSGKKRASARLAAKHGSKKAKEHTVYCSEEYEHTIDLITVGGVVKKLVKGHSIFGKSPFELNRHMHTISIKKKAILFYWIENDALQWGSLTSEWFRIDYPLHISLLGYNLKTEFSLSGSFTTRMVDALSISSLYLDDDSCGKLGTRWRHFLPARFTEAVLRGEEYLEAKEIEALFIGEHIKYDVENCRMIIAPVLYHGRWSCYFWDFQRRTITVLDPTRMKTNATNVALHHEHVVNDLTNALFACIERFFNGWDFEKRGWEEIYRTNCGKRCRISNSGLYSILYSRYFDGDNVVCAPNQGGLLEPCSHLLYHLLRMRSNLAQLPPFMHDLVFKILGT